MKKIQALALLPIIALASCGKGEETKTETTPTPSEVAIPEVTPEVTVVTQESTPETLNENIATATTQETWVSTKEFNLTYNLPDGRPLEFSGNLEIENGKIISVNFPKYDLTNPQSYEVKFAVKLQSDIIGKEVKGLQYDGMSGASLTTNAFNEFLNTINK